MCICGVCMQNAQLGGNMYYIGVDLGTSAVKLLLMEESGKICNIVSKEYPLFFPHPGWSEPVSYTHLTLPTSSLV